MEETIVAPATPVGRGGVSIVRISGDIADCDDRMRGWSQAIRRMGRSSGYR